MKDVMKQHLPETTFDNATINATSNTTARRRTSKRSTQFDGVLSPEIRAAIEDIVEAVVKRRYVDPNAEAFSVKDFCRRYGIGHQTAYNQIADGHLVAHKPVGCDRTLIRRVDSERWIENAPTIKPAASSEAA